MNIIVNHTNDSLLCAPQCTLVSDLTKCFLSGTISFSVRPSYLNKMKGRDGELM